MLANLKIENVAVIEKAEVNFTHGFTVLTGETGAGKSILIDSINAILGNRTSRELVRSGAQKACIWATFEAIPASVKKQLEKCGYEASDDLLLYREINAEGKGSCRINGMPATAAVVRDISAGLLSIHGQHDSQSLTNPALHLDLLDQYAQNRELFAEYYRRYRELVTVKRQLDTANASEADKQRRIEALTAEIDAIDAAALQPGEEKTLQERKTVITHAQSILEGITAAHLALAGDEDGEQAGAADLLGSAVDGLQNSARLDESLAAMSERLNELYYSARDLATDLADRLDAYGFDAGELDQIESQDAVLAELQKIEGVDKVEYGQSLSEMLMSVSNVFQVAGILVMLVLGVISVMIIINTIRISVMNRRVEINIMKYVGATDWFIRWPFIIEGIIIGLIGAVLPMLVGMPMYGKTVSLFYNHIPFVENFVRFRVVGDVFSFVLPAALIFGILLGVVGSVTSIRKHLQV